MLMNKCFGEEAKYKHTRTRTHSQHHPSNDFYKRALVSSS